MGYAIMSNHFHLVIRYDPQACNEWSDEEVARRWCAVFNGLPLDRRLYGPTELDDFNLKQTIRYHEMLLDSGRLEKSRKALGSLSRFMQHLKQPFAVWANHETDTSGHFFESRFYSGVLLTQSDLLSCMGYVDLNPVEAGIAKSLKEAEHTSAFERLQATRFDKDKLESFLSGLWDDEELETEPLCSLGHYLEQLNIAITLRNHPNSNLTDKLDGWMARLVNRERRIRRNMPAPFFDYA